MEAGYPEAVLRQSLLRRTLLQLPLPVILQAQARRTPLQILESHILQLTRSVNAQWGIYMKCLETGEEIAMDADRQMDTMSVIKIPLMVEVFRQIAAGRFSLTDRVRLREEDKRPGTGVIRSMDAGIELTVKDLLTLMIIVSDNTATDILFEKTGGVEATNALMKQYGYTAIRATAPCKAWFDALRAAPNAAEFHRAGKNPYGLGSPRELGNLLEKIKRGQAVSPAASEMMLQIMRGQVYRSRLPKYITNFAVPHKTGDFLPYIGNDTGILESRDRNIVVCVFTAQHFGNGNALEDTIGRVGEQIADYYTYREPK